MNYKTKYLKYKIKYINLKMLNLYKFSGGAGTAIDSDSDDDDDDDTRTLSGFDNDDDDNGNYKELMLSLETTIPTDSKKIITYMTTHEATINDIITIIDKYTKSKELFIQYFSFAIPSVNSILQITQFANNEQILEVGAGNGLWAGLLKFVGCNIIATDNFSKEWKTGYVKYIDVEELSATKAIEKYNTANVLFLCWPPEFGGMAYRSIILFKGNKLIYIGYYADQSYTGGDAFHEILNKDWKHVTSINISSWAHDSVHLFTRKPTPNPIADPGNSDSDTDL